MTLLEKYFEVNFGSGRILEKILKKFGQFFGKTKEKDERYEFLAPQNQQIVESPLPPPINAFLGGFSFPQPIDHHIGGFPGEMFIPSTGHGFRRGDKNAFHHFKRDINEEDKAHSKSDENQHKYGRHKRKHLTAQEKLEDMKKKIVVISEHDQVIDAQINQHVPFEVILQNLSNRNVPKNTYLVKDEEYDDNLIIFESLNLETNIHPLEQKHVTMIFKMPNEPGEHI